MNTEKMKTRIRLLAAWVLLLSANSLSALAQDEAQYYNLRIAGVMVTSENYNPVKAPTGSNAVIEGVSYDYATHTLTLDNARIDARNVGEGWGESAIYKDGNHDVLTIKLIGKSTIYSDYVTVYMKNKLNIVSGEEGDARPQLNIVSSPDNVMFGGIEAIAATNRGTAEINIQGCDVDIVGAGEAIRGYDNYGDGTYDKVDLLISPNASLRAKSTSANSSINVFKHVKALNHDGLTITLPKNATWSETLMSFTKNGSTPLSAKEARITSYIDFEDNSVKNICVATWDDNSDERLDMIEARLVTSLDGKFQGNTQIKKFNELKYFTGIPILDFEAFSECTSLESVELPALATIVGGWAFSGAEKLTKVTIPKSYMTIEGFAFYNCTALSELAFEENSRVGVIDSYAFCSCPITTLTLPNHLTTIGEMAFYENCLNRIEIPSSITTIGDRAFYQGNNFESTLAKVVVYNDYNTTPATIGDGAFGGTLTGYMGKVPNNFHILLNESSVTAINKYKNAWPQYADYIGGRTMYGIYVAGQELAEDNIGSDGSFSFKSSDAEASGIYFHDGVLLLKDAQIKSPRNVPAIMTYVKNMILELDGQNIINSSGRGIQAAADINIYKAPGTYNNSRPSLTINSANEGIYCDNTPWNEKRSITISNCELNINSSNTSCIATDGSFTEFVGQGPVADVNFYYVKAVLNANGNVVLKDMGGIVFDGCSILKPEGAMISMDGDGIVDDYGNYVTDEVCIGGWITFEDENVKQLCIQNFDANHDGGLDEFEAAKVESIGYFFNQNHEITSFNELIYFTGISEIPDYAFMGCENLQRITFPDNVKRIGDFAFSGTQLFCPDLPNYVEEIGQYAFQGSQWERQLSIPYSLKTIGEGAFARCLKGGGVLFDEENQDKYQLETIGNYAFSNMYDPYYEGPVNCIPQSVKSIGDYAFSGCETLQLTVYGNVPASIGQGALGGLPYGDFDYEYFIRVPDGKVRAYKEAWSEYKDYIVGEELPIATGINQNASAISQRPGIYTLDGRCIRKDCNTQGLPKGLYIIDGKKVSVK